MSSATRYPLTCRRLRAVGIDPKRILLDGLHLAGFETVDEPRTPDKPRRPHQLKTTWHRWALPPETVQGILAASRTELRRHHV